MTSTLANAVNCAKNPNAPCYLSTCNYHNWLRNIESKADTLIVGSPIPTVVRNVLLSATSAPAPLVQTGMYRASKRARVEPLTPAVQRLLKFLRLARIFNQAPWASSFFDVNNDIFLCLTASHLPLICGKDSIKKERHKLLQLLAAHRKLDGSGNLLWITNRQQGKTTTVARFIALLACTAICGGLLCTIYAPSLDRAVELLKAVKQYINWFKAQPSGAHIKYARDCERMFVLDNGQVCNELAARPKNVESCRGDAPACAFFDEVAFIDESFWYNFAYPLLQVESRIFTCITTPPPPRGFFAQFVASVRERNAQGDTFFLLVNHSLSCEACVKLDQADRCSHRLHLVPPWKSLLRFAQMKRLVPASRKATFAQEVFGVLSEKNDTYFPAPLVRASLGRRVPFAPADTLWVSIDPASHGVSNLGILAFSVNGTGLHIIHGLCGVNVHRCQMEQLSAIVRQFMHRLRALHPHATIIPIIETNNNEIAAMTLLQAVGPCEMPFTRDRFETYISPDIGVVTTNVVKLAAVQQTYLLILNGGIAVSEQMIVADRTAFESRAPTFTPDELLTELGAQLIRFQDQPNGTVSGKTTHGDNDDMAMCLLLGVYWRICVVSSTTLGTSE